MLAREENMESEYLKNEMHKLIPVVNPNGSDSARLDNTLEFLVMSGMDLPHAVMITIPGTVGKPIKSFHRKRRIFISIMQP